MPICQPLAGSAARPCCQHRMCAACLRPRSHNRAYLRTTHDDLSCDTPWSWHHKPTLIVGPKRAQHVFILGHLLLIGMPAAAASGTALIPSRLSKRRQHVAGAAAEGGLACRPPAARQLSAAHRSPVASNISSMPINMLLSCSVGGRQELHMCRCVQIMHANPLSKQGGLDAPSTAWYVLRDCSNDSSVQD